MLHSVPISDARRDTALLPFAGLAVYVVTSVFYIFPSGTPQPADFILVVSIGGTLLLAGNSAFGMMWGIGGIIGPSMAGGAMDLIGPEGLPLTLGVLFGLGAAFPRVPWALIVVVVSIVASNALGWADSGIAVVGGLLAGGAWLSGWVALWIGDGSFACVREDG